MTPEPVMESTAIARRANDSCQGDKPWRERVRENIAARVRTWEGFFSFSRGGFLQVFNRNVLTIGLTSFLSDPCREMDAKEGYI